MDDKPSDKADGGVGLLGVIIGAALVIAVAFFFFGGFAGTMPQKVDVTVTPPATAPAPPRAPATPPAASVTPAPPAEPKP